MADFNPDEYLAQKQSDFDPDAYLAQNQESKPGYLASGVRGAAQGGTFGFADEISGAGNAAFQAAKKLSTEDLVKDYIANRDAYREADREAAEANPYTYGTGQVLGGVGSAVLTPGIAASGVAGAIGLGALQGYGGSEAEDPTEQIKDIGIGGTLGAAGYGAGKMLSKAIPTAQSAKEYARRKVIEHLRPTPKIARVLGPERLGTVADEVLDNNLVGFGQKAGDTAERVAGAKDLVGQEIGQYVDEATAAGKTIDPNIVANRVRSEVVDPLNKTAITKPIAGSIDELASDFTSHYSPEGALAETQPVSSTPFKKVTPKKFLETIKGNKRTPFLSPKTEADLAGHQLYVTDDGVGYALSPDGDLQNVFNNSGKPGAGKEAVKHAIQNGAKTLDAFDGHLPEYYNNFGFKLRSASKFDKMYAPEGWDYATHGTPDVIYMEYPEHLARDANSVAKRFEVARSARSEGIAGVPGQGLDPSIPNQHKLFDWPQGGGLDPGAPGATPGSTQVHSSPVSGMTPAQLEAEKRAVQASINYLTDPKAKQQAMMDYARILKEESERAIDNPKFVPAKQRFSKLSDAQMMAERTAGLTDSGTGLLGHLHDISAEQAAMQALLHGEPATGAAIAGGRAAVRGRTASALGVGSNEVSKFLSARPTLDAAARGLKNQLPQIGSAFGRQQIMEKIKKRPGAHRFAQVIQNAASKGDASLASTHYILSQTEPEYASAFTEEE